MSTPDEAERPSHRIRLVVPKPSAERIRRMTAEYYTEQAGQYDDSDREHAGREAYVDAIDRLITEDLARHPVGDFLALACGTGRRAARIRAMTGMDYDITGVDVSPEMSARAHDRGLAVINDAWVDADLPEDEGFDAAGCLYAFGHIPTEENRRRALLKLHRHLVPGAPFYLDVFNIDDETEWGPRVRRYFHTHRLQLAGYDEGDVFYRKAGGRRIAFLQYFSKDEITGLLASSGFCVEEVVPVGYGRAPGELLDAPDGGALFIKAIRR